MALEDFRRQLAGGKFRYQAQALELRAAAHPDRVEIPAAEVYLVDSQGPRAITESLLAAMGKRNPGGRVIVVAERFTDATAFAALRLGARGLLTYEQAREQLPTAIEAVATGGLWVPRAVLSRFVDHVMGHQAAGQPETKPVNLSRREQEVCDALLENLSNKEIASRLNISERTVKFHVSNVLAKFGVRRRADLIVHCFQTQRP